MVYIVLPNEVKMNINKCICDWIHKKGFGTKYVMYTLDYIKKNKCNLKSVYGIIYYLNNAKILEDYESTLKTQKYNSISQSKFNTDDDEVKFTYNSDNGEGWCKIL